jgi:hypothetical protein
MVRAAPPSAGAADGAVVNPEGAAGTAENPLGAVGRTTVAAWIDEIPHNAPQHPTLLANPNGELEAVLNLMRNGKGVGSKMEVGNLIFPAGIVYLRHPFPAR